MSTSLADHTAVITGAGSGIGRALATHLAHTGCAVVINDINTSRCNDVARTLSKHGLRAAACPGDASDIAVIGQMIQVALERFGRLDLAIANAGLTPFEDFFAITPDTFSRIMQVNLHGTFFLAQAAADAMQTSGRGGRILLMSSVLAEQPYPGLAPYCMSKAAISMLARTLALELAPWNIHVNALAPGATVTERTIQDDARYSEHWAMITPSGRAASVDEIARIGLFLVSPEASHIRGQTIVVDGGWSNSGQFPEMLRSPTEMESKSIMDPEA